MDYVELAVLGAMCAGISAFFALFWRWLLDWKRDNRITQLERQFHSLDQKIRGDAGNEARQEQAERMAEAMAEAGALAQAGKQPKEIIATLLPKYPDVALKLGKKYLKL